MTNVIDARSIQVSPRHWVTPDADYLPMIDRAPREDFVVRTMALRKAGETPLMSAELVIAGAATRERYPLAHQYPLHFRKTYYPGRLHGEPAVEFERHAFASTLIAVPAPIGYTRSTFRSCLLPGTPLNRVSELGAQPEESNIALARALPLAAAAGLWRLTETAYETLRELQRGGLSHGDAHLHNFIVCPSPLEVLPIDFEQAVTQRSLDPAAWQAHCTADRQHLLKLAIYLLCALGGQHSPMAREAMQRLDALVRPADTFRRAITERTFASSFT